jgi:serine phosphatase RsbU (regulator of sigma subunit)
MSTTADASEAAAASRPLLREDLGSFLLGSFLALILLWYIHGNWQPNWAMVCGAVGGVITRRWIRPSYATFPTYIRRPVSIGVIALGTVFASWATLAREPLSVWLLRWREAVTLPIVGGILGLGLASVIYTHRRLEREIEAKRRLEDDLTVASRIQQSLLQTRVPDRRWVETHAVNLASRQIGGDYYEIIDSGDTGICFAVGDVSGKGVPAALLMSSLQSAFLAAYSIDPRLDRVCTIVNKFLYEKTTPERYATFFVGQLSPQGHLAFVNAGHNPPLLMDHGAPERLFGGGRPLGLFGDSDYVVHERQLRPDSLLVVFTDGVTEAVNTREEEFGEARLSKLMTSHSGGTATDIAAAVLEGIRSHSGGVADQHDDITLLVLRPRTIPS